MSTRVATIITRCIAGGGGVAVRGALSLDQDRYDGVLVTGSGDGLLDRARAHGVDVIVMPELVSPISPRNDAVAFAELTRLLRSRRVDVVHTHSAKAGVLGRVAAHRAGVPRIVHTLHGFPFHEFQRPPVRSAYVGIERRLSAITDAYLAVGTAVAVEAIRRGFARADQIRTIGPAVEPPTVRASERTRADARRALGLPDDALVIGTVGRMDFQKAPEVLIEALARMVQPAILVWAGDGPLTAQARSCAQALGVADRVRLLGNRDDVPEILPAFDVFAMSSRYEGLPCVIVEAQQCGIPVVATAVNAVPDVVIPGESGLLVPPQRPDLLAGALDHALTHPAVARSWARTAQSRLGTRYDLSELGNVLEEVYAGHERRAPSLPEPAPAGALA